MKNTRDGKSNEKEEENENGREKKRVLKDITRESVSHEKIIKSYMHAKIVEKIMHVQCLHIAIQNRKNTEGNSQVKKAMSFTKRMNNLKNQV